MMPISPIQSWALILTMALVTAGIRFFPFWVFRKNTPKLVLPGAVMAMLVVYCLKDLDLLGSNHGLPQIISVGVVAVLHKWKHNTLLSILGGTLCNMILLQTIFAV